MEVNDTVSRKEQLVCFCIYYYTDSSVYHVNETGWLVNMRVEEHKICLKYVNGSLQHWRELNNSSTFNEKKHNFYINKTKILKNILSLLTEDLRSKSFLYSQT